MGSKEGGGRWATVQVRAGKESITRAKKNYPDQLQQLYCTFSHMPNNGSESVCCFKRQQAQRKRIQHQG